MTENKKNLVKLVGWQSWSSTTNGLRLHPRNYSPFGENDQFIPKEKLSLKPPITGWCSWYCYGARISHDRIVSHADWIDQERKDIPLDYLLIDDGWTTLGDWLESDEAKFPQGMSTVASEIKLRSLKPGLWLAPFLVRPHSKIARQHPEWLIRKRNGKFLDGGKALPQEKFIPFRRFVLDLRIHEVQNYLKNVIHTIVKDWGYDLLKLDFLYSGHFNPDFNNSKEPDLLLRNFLLWIKENYPDVYTIACGCPLVPAVGAVDAMRLSEDTVIPQLKNIPIINTVIHRARLLQLEANLKYRQVTESFWTPDPDVFICEGNYGLSETQILRLGDLIRKTKGLVFLGDNLTALDPKRISKYIHRLFK